MSIILLGVNIFGYISCHYTIVGNWRYRCNEKNNFIRNINIRETIKIDDFFNQTQYAY